MAEDLVYFDRRAFRDLEDRFRSLGSSGFGKALQFGLNDVSLEANKALAISFERHIAGGPVAWTKINPGQRKSSVV
jgi:hypothetical protein